MENEGYIVPSGFCQGVAPGGYMLGGGIGPLSRQAGHGVDNVIEITMVAMNGSIISVTGIQNNYCDLYLARLCQ